MKVTLNADMGEGFGPWTMGDDAALLPLIGSASLACGFHAGDPMTMLRVAKLALAAGVSVGAHPGFDDLRGFGRRRIETDPAEIPAMLAYQIGALSAVCALARHRVTHVKPHGALYTMACADPALAGAVAAAVSTLNRSLILVAPAGSALAVAAGRYGLRLAAEAFCDRTYESDGSLTPRSVAGAVIHDPAEAAARAVAMVRDQAVVSRQGRVLPTRIDTLCLHGDAANAPEIAGAVAAALDGIGVRRVSLPELDLG